MVPAALLTSGTFSLIRDFRVPNSAQGAAAASCSASPEGSTKTGIRALGRGGISSSATGWGKVEGPGPPVARDLDLEVSPRTRLGLEPDEDETPPSGTSGGGA